MNKGFYDGYHFRVGDALFGALALIAILENSIVVFAIGGMVFDFGVASFSGTIAGDIKFSGYNRY
ncbi:hypothetical protein YZ82_09140 [Campylobacter hyointestinalis]|uniref:Uncharacterized protein n=1 Tax=Campylobacter hyointestinalis TaxID=198 RepID=A0A562X7I0_CAMHY|nr:hypothetical protein [Campylobacter hyointestinalis]RAZ54444.1 hypothetical protein CHL10074_07385 [Campylobacter hyointestinalis subsp. lawsonii]RAZ65215.1 hypothetical protein CHL9767_01620 [Campylobacter hyointestinalis subsp. lawsonii]TWO18154.1 hypothetical protein YZ82_09140 [Campylobacter hyointestinalis]